MTREDIKIDDLLFHVNLEFGEYLINEVFVEEINEEEKCYFGIKCKISSDDERYDGRVILVNEDELFETRKEALEYVLEKTKDYQESYKRETVRATIELEEENNRIKKIEEKEHKVIQIIGKVITLGAVVRKTLKHPCFSRMFSKDIENEEFLNALNIVTEFLRKNIEEQDEGTERLLKEIFGKGE